MMANLTLGVPGGDLVELLDLRRVDPGGFLDQRVDAGGERGDADLGVQIVGNRRDDGVHITAGEQRPVIVVDGHAVPGARHVAPHGVDVGDGADPHVGHHAVSDELRVHRALRSEADDAEPDHLVSHWPFSVRSWTRPPSPSAAGSVDLWSVDAVARLPHLRPSGPAGQTVSRSCPTAATGRVAATVRAQAWGRPRQQLATGGGAAPIRARANHATPTATLSGEPDPCGHFRDSPTRARPTSRNRPRCSRHWGRVPQSLGRQCARPRRLARRGDPPDARAGRCGRGGWRRLPAREREGDRPRHPPTLPRHSRVGGFAEPARRRHGHAHPRENHP